MSREVGWIFAADQNPSARRLKLYRAIDALGLLLLAGGISVAILGGPRFEVLGITISLRSELRLFFWSATLLLFRYVRDPQRSVLGRSLVVARRPGPYDEAALFAKRDTRQRLLEFAGLFVAFGALVAIHSWPQVGRLWWVSDLGDPLFSIWRISWISHQLIRDPMHLFDGNMFHPEPLTLTYSDPVLVPAMMTAPLLWANGHPVVVYNLLFLSGFALSGVTMFLLVRALTGLRAAAAVAGVIFAIYPYRYEHYSHLELQMTMWMPLALHALHRTIARERLRDGLAMGAAFALQTLSCLYYGLFFSIYVLPLTAILWIGHRSTWRAARSLAAGALLAVLLVLPVAIAFTKSKPIVGERNRHVVEQYSASLTDYFDANPRSWLYGKLIQPGDPERELFPGVTPVAVTAVGLWPPLSSVRIGYALALALAFDGSLGVNGLSYPWLYEHVEPFRSLRVPARFSILLGMTLAILGGYGTARLVRRWPRRGWAIAGGLIALTAIEARPALPLERAWRHPPPIYDSLAGGSGAVLAEFPMAGNEEQYFIDARYLYFSTVHWQKLVNGNSGFFPPSYRELIKRMRDFPSETALAYLRRRGVTHLAVHAEFYENPQDYTEVIARLDARPDLERVAASRWEGSESRLYRFRQ